MNMVQVCNQSGQIRHKSGINHIFKKLIHKDINLGPGMFSRQFEKL
jgi:hypothetical protein